MPDLFYRIEDNVNLSYDSKGIKKGKSLKEELGWELPTMDIISCIANLKVDNNVATVGFCYGGNIIMECCLQSLWTGCFRMFLWVANNEIS